MEYLLKDSTNEPKRVVRGNSGLTLDIIRSVPFKQKYKSGVLSFEESEIDPNVAESIMDGFEQTIFSGIEDGDRNILWVEHRDKERVELHFIIPRIHLGSQKAFNPFWHKVDLTRVDTFKELVNLQYGLSDPNDPDKERSHSYAYNPSDKRLIDVSKDELVETLYELVEDGVINNRNELIDALKSAGYAVPRIGKNYISIQASDWKKAKRFKGGIFNESFTSVSGLEKEAKRRVKDYQRNRNNREAGIEKLSQKLERLNQQKALYHTQRYSKNQLPSGVDTSVGNTHRSRDDVALPLRRSCTEKRDSSIPDNPTGAVDEQEKYIDPVVDGPARKRARGERGVSAKTRRDRTSRFEEFKNSRKSLFEQTFGAKRERRSAIVERADRGLKQAGRELAETARRIDEAAQIVGDIIEKSQKGRGGGTVGGGTR
ncbi:relaxase/mobilization nuclease domain-containing protein [Sulfurimonas sp. HSL-3221]|uniref:relaxase/mobilization nuclease domain-containing protein n=1 Tax=Sulfurimonadaceae TaxID=2771471 RepID=UPI001E2D1970|nr:relaxase/mobilization nuclease domain-containing protein [Sulfurimonas sp. HSL-3221]UFS61819.1 relaxase/mobilization nuclease domain-containing protein [Sulfurimonas sp. HSL-3221]